MNRSTMHLFASLTSVALLVSSLPLAAETAVPDQMTYQALITDNENNALGEEVPTNYDITFRIYNVANNGVAIWTELQTVSVFQGHFSVLLGAGAIPDGSVRPAFEDVFEGESERYIGITLENSTEFSPRQQILANAYAFRAKVAESVSGKISFDGSTAQIDGALNVVNGANFGNNLTVVGATQLNGGFTSAGISSHDGPLSLTGTTGNLAVAGATQLNGGFTSAGNSSHAGPLSLTGPTGNLSLTDPTGTLTVAGATQLNGGFTSAGNSSHAGPLSLTGPTGNLSLTDPTGTLTVAGATQLNGGLNVTDGLNVTGDTVQTGKVFINSTIEDAIRGPDGHVFVNTGGPHANQDITYDFSHRNNMIVKAENPPIPIPPGSPWGGTPTFEGGKGTIVRNDRNFVLVVASTVAPGNKRGGSGENVFAQTLGPGAVETPWASFWESAHPRELDGREFFNSNTYTRMFEIHTGGAIKSGSSWDTFSDRRLKKNIQNLTGSLDKLLKLRSVNFEFKNPKLPGYAPGKQTGFIAQEVEEIFPDWITEIASGVVFKGAPSHYKLIGSHGFEALAVQALRELRAEKDTQNEVQNAQIDALKEANSTLENRLTKLEALLEKQGSGLKQGSGSIKESN